MLDKSTALFLKPIKVLLVLGKAKCYEFHQVTAWLCVPGVDTKLHLPLPPSMVGAIS